MKRMLAILSLLLLAAQPAAAADAESTSFVNLPLAEYNRLLEITRDPKKDPRPAPAAYAIGKADLDVRAHQQGERVVAEVVATIEVQVLENEWTAVPILPAGTAVKNVTANGSDIQLGTGTAGLFFSSQEAKSHVLVVHYSVDAARNERGAALSIPVPSAAAITLNATLPEANLDATVIPSAGTMITSKGEETVVQATIPSTSGVMVSWRLPEAGDAVISRAAYRGEVQKSAIVWSAELSVDVSSDEPIALPLMPKEITIREISVDQKPAPLKLVDRRFTTTLRGKGSHTIRLEFQTPFNPNATPQHVQFSIPEIPISRFEVKLPGKKDITVEPEANVTRTEEDGQTTAVFNVPLSSYVLFRWSEAVPEEIKEELRTNASLIHTFVAEEGVLTGVGYATLEVTRGELNALQLEASKEVQINKILAPDEIIADWRVVRGDTNVIEIFFNRAVKGSLPLEIHYDRSLVSEEDRLKLHLPLLKVRGVQRQRGMVALLSSKELTFKPIEEKSVTKVGENQLPAELRQAIDKTIAHTYKYVEEAPVLVVQAAKPERTEGRFDAEVNTLISLSDVSLRGAATIDVNVKSGAIPALRLHYPSGVNVLSLTAPSLRTYKVLSDSTPPAIDVQFTQDMEGQFRVELAYERIITDSEGDLSVPTISVQGTEVEQGRIAVEALSAVEVAAAESRQLSSLEPTELPQQLVLKTTNPILLAFKYVQTDPPPYLSLRVTRHREIEVQSAAIDNATYRTLVTEDGLAVTVARFSVRNTSQQFLKVQLPSGSSVWSALVDGKPEKPALATSREGDPAQAPQVLLKIISSNRPFPVELMYQTPVNELGRFGKLHVVLPRPTMVVTHTRWELFLPDSKRYASPDSNLTVLAEGEPVSRQLMENEVAGDGRAAVTPLQVTVPAAGIRYTLEKLYANQSDDDAYLSLAYASPAGSGLLYLLLIGATTVFWLTFATLVVRASAERPRPALPAMVISLGIVAYVIGYLRFDYMPAALVTAVSAVLLLIYVARQKLEADGVAQAQAELPAAE